MSSLGHSLPGHRTVLVQSQLALTELADQDNVLLLPAIGPWDIVKPDLAEEESMRLLANLRILASSGGNVSENLLRTPIKLPCGRASVESQESDPPLAGLRGHCAGQQFGGAGLQQR